MRMDEGIAGASRRLVVRALEAEGVPCYEGYCQPLYLQRLYQADWPGKDGRAYGPGLCPVTERMYERELFYHVHLYPALREPFIEEMCRAFEKVWAQREALAKMADDGATAVRRA
jgi:perosamine synthetase